MATTITSDCINCGACEPECPNTAIYAGGAAWELRGTTSPALAQDIFYIVAQKCTECVGFYDHEACAAVCPVDCCIPDPKNPETHDVLIARARDLHPELTIADDAPSRFHKEGAASAPTVNALAEGGASDAAAAPSPVPSAAAIPAPAAPSAAPPAAPKAAAAAPKAVAETPKAPAAAKTPTERPPVAAPAAMLNLPKDIGAVPPPLPEKHFAGELEQDFDSVLASVDLGSAQSTPVPVAIALRLAEPLLGAMPDKAKAHLEEAAGPSAFSRVRSSALNMLLNVLIYPFVVMLFGILVMGDKTFSQQTSGWLTLGVTLACIEAVWRMREGILHGKPASEITYRAACYGMALAPLGSILAGGATMRRSERKVAFDGFMVDLHDDKLERERRYGNVYTVSEHAGAYLIRLEMPRKLPPSSLKRLWDLPDEMPDYDYNITLADDVLSIRASVRGDALRRLCSVSPAFPADFDTRIDFDKTVWTFKHRLRNKIIEVIVLKGEAPLVASEAKVKNAA
ncbi:MAG TPA: 4Fe-4S dicluster domain-containing protein [Candidatus Binataceae bacterium]|nr:4Fe-4S dicluster domain-containing protein [Candidatus Binataceae bacterium]